MFVEASLPDTHPVGDLTLAEMRLLENIRAGTDAALHRLGEIEIEKHQIVAAVTGLREQSLAVLSSVAVRLGIPSGTEWTVDRDGTIRVVTL
jgi:hypothetical protein